MRLGMFECSNNKNCRLQIYQKISEIVHNNTKEAITPDDDDGLP